MEMSPAAHKHSQVREGRLSQAQKWLLSVRYPGQEGPSPDVPQDGSRARKATLGAHEGPARSLPESALT